MFPVVLRSQDTDKFVLFKSPVDGQFVHELFIVNKAFETLQPFVVEVRPATMDIYIECEVGCYVVCCFF